MPYTKRLVCLANSRKQQGHCIAGKEITAEGFGNWIRPISSEDDGKLWNAHIRYENGQVPSILDVVRITFIRRKLHGYQTENHLINESVRWQHIGEVDLAELPTLCDPVDTIWINGFHSYSGINDRIPLAVAAELQSSLLLIKPTRIRLRVAQELNSRKVRANFIFGETTYQLAVTDPVAERLYRAREDGEYSITRRNIYFCISLSEPFDGFTYKLVAAIINLPLN